MTVDQALTGDIGTDPAERAEILAAEVTRLRTALTAAENTVARVKGTSERVRAAGRELKGASGRVFAFVADLFDDALKGEP